MEKRTFSFTLDEQQISFLNRLLSSSDLKGQEVGLFTNLMSTIQAGITASIEASKAEQPTFEAPEE